MDSAADTYMKVPLKIRDFMVITIGTHHTSHDYSEYIGPNRIPVIEIICEDGVFLVALSSEDYEKLE